MTDKKQRLAHPLDLGVHHPAVLLLPRIVGLLADASLSSDFFDRGSVLTLPDD